MAEIGIALAVSAITSAASAGLQYALTPKPKKPAPVDRGKLDDLRFSLPAYGAQIIKAWGTMRCAPTWFWHTPAIDIPVTTPGQQGGKGGGAPPTADVTEHRYFKNLAGVFHDGQIQSVARIWFDNELVMNAPLATNLATTSSNRYEAENGVLAGGASVATQAECSDGRKVTGIGNGGSATIHCDVSGAAIYEVAVGYTSTVERTFKVSVNGGASQDLICAASGGAGLVAIQTIRLSLSNGANTIAFANASALCPDLDYISIAPPLSFTSGVDPRSFTGLQMPGRVAPTDPDIFWPVNDEPPVFSDPTGGLAGGGNYSTTLAKWGSPQIRIYLGSETQLPDPLIESIKGVGNTSAYRGLAYIVIEGLQMINGRIPNVTIEFAEGTRSCSAILTSLGEMVGLPAGDFELSSLNGLILGDSTGFSPGSYTAINWTGLVNATQTGGGAITKTSGANNTWNAYAVQGTTVSSGTDAAIRFTAGTGVFMIGFSTTATPGSSLPNPYNQVLIGIILNTLGNPSQTAKNAIQMSLGGSNNTTDIGVWAPGDTFQVEIRNGRGKVYQNGLLLTGFTPPPLTFPLNPIFVGYATGGGPSAASYATGVNIGSEPIITNSGALILDSQREAGELVEELMTRFQFLLPEVDGKIKAVRLDAASDLTLTEAECQAYRGDGLPPKIEISRKNPLSFPKKTIINYSDSQLDYHNNSQVEMRLYGPQQHTLNVNLAMVETGANMKKLTAVLSSRAEVEGQTYKFTVGPKHKHIHQGTVLTITEGSSTHQVRVTDFRPDLPAGLGEVEAVRQSSVFDPSVVTVDIGTEAPVVPIPGNTKGVFIDAPLIPPESTAESIQPLVYVAMSGRGSGNWPAGFLFREFPLNSDNYQLLTSTDKPAQIGQTDGALGTHSDPTVLDTVNSLALNFHTLTALESVTLSDLQSNDKLNLIAIENGVGEWEYMQFQTATPGVATAPYVSRYTISNLLRGRFHTEAAITGHATGKEAVIMQNGIKAILLSTALLDISCNYKFMTAGQHIDQVPVRQFTWRGVSLKPPAPSDLNALHDSSGDWLISAVGHPREAERPETYIARLRRASTGTLLRDIPIAPGMRMAAILGHIVHTAEGGTWIGIEAQISQNNVTGELDGTAAYVTQPVANGSEINARVTLTPAPSPWLNGNVTLSFGPSDFTDPFGVITGATISRGDNSTTLTRINVFDWSTSQHSFFDLPTVDGVVYVRVVWSGTELRWQFSGSPINAAAKPNAILKDIAPAGPTFLRISLVNGGPTGASVSKVENIALGGLSPPQTIYSLAQQQNDNSGVGIATGDLSVEMWQVSPLAPDGKGISVTGVF